MGAALEIEALLGRRVSEDTSGGAKASAEEAIMQAKQHNKRSRHIAAETFVGKPGNHISRFLPKSQFFSQRRSRVARSA